MLRTVKSTTLASAPGTPDSPAFHFVSLRSATGRLRVLAHPHRAAEACKSGGTAPSAGREASLPLHFSPLRENRRDRRGPPRRESGQLLLQLRCSFLCAWACAEAVRPHAAPMLARHLSAGANRDPCTLPAQPLPPRAWTTRPPRPIQPHAQNGLRFVRGCHEGCSRLPDTRAVICSAAKTAPAPARRTPGAGGR